MWRVCLWRNTAVAAALLLTAAWASPAFAADDGGCKSCMKDCKEACKETCLKASDARADKAGNLIMAGRLIGMPIVDSSGKKVGSVNDLVLSRASDVVQFVVVSSHHPDTDIERLVAVPWAHFTLSADRKSLSAEFNVGRLAGANGFAPRQWPDMTSATWLRDTYRYWGATTRPDVDTRGAMGILGGGKSSDESGFNMRRVSHLRGVNVRANKDESVGSLRTLVIDLRDGRPVFAVVSLVCAGGDKHQASLIPWPSVDLRPSINAARIDADRKTIEGVAFGPTTRPDLSDRAYLSRLYGRFNQEPYWESFGYTGGSAHGGLTTFGWEPGSEYNKLYDSSNSHTITGTIRQTGTFKPGWRSVDGLVLKVETDHGMVTAHVGPLPYILDQKIRFSHGDAVTIDASKVNWKGQWILLAGSVTKGDQVLKLYGGDGKPLWDVASIQAYADQFNRDHKPKGRGGLFGGHRR